MKRFRPIKRLKEIWRRYEFYRRRDQFDRELEAEMAFHIEMRARDAIDSGLAADNVDSASRAARRRFGNVTLAQERSRDMWTFRWLETLGQDIRYSLRMIKQSPMLSAAVILSLGLAIGANTAIFSLVNGVLLKMLPVKDPSQLVLLSWASNGPAGWMALNGSTNRDAAGRTISASFSEMQFERMRDQNQTLSDVFAFARVYQLNVSAGDQSDVASGQEVSGGFYKGLGVRAVLGRTLTDDDDKPGANPAAVISYQYWKDRFSLDPNVIGKSVYINGVQFTIVGVTPAAFAGALDVVDPPELTIPLATEGQIHWSAPARDKTWYWWLRIMGRIKPGVSYDQVQANLEGTFQQTALQGHRDYFTKNPKRVDRDKLATPSLVVTAGGHGVQESKEEFETPLTILMIVVGLVLLIACANAANLLLARAGARRREIAIRLAVGASRRRLIRQLMTESLMMAAAAGIVGVVLAFWGKDLAIAMIQATSPEKVNIPALDVRVLAFTAGVSILTGLLFGIAPALRATRLDLTPALKENSASQGRGGFRFGLGKGLIALQVAVSLLLLVGAGLFLRTLRNLEHVDYGFDANNLLLFDINPGLNGYRTQRLADVYQRLADRLNAIPGVRGATCAEAPLIAHQQDITNGLLIPGSNAPKDAQVFMNHVGPTFLETMGIPVLLGRGLARSDGEGSPKVVVANKAFADVFFPGDNPIGKRFKFEESDKDYLVIVGMTGNAKYDSLRGDSPPTLYLPYLQDVENLGGQTFSVRTAAVPLSLVPAVRQALLSIDPNLAITRIKTQVEQIDESLSQERLFAGFTLAFGALAVVLSCLGLYGVMSYSVSRRTNEIGIRMALGANSGRVLRQVMRETMLTVTVGVILGVVASLAAGKLIASMLFGLTASDPITIAGSVAALAAVAAIASFLPARRAAKIDPMDALRYE